MRRERKDRIDHYPDQDACDDRDEPYRNAHHAPPFSTLRPAAVIRTTITTAPPTMHREAVRAHDRFSDAVAARREESRAPGGGRALYDSRRDPRYAGRKDMDGS
jgi:hypothetical protein